MTYDTLLEYAGTIIVGVASALLASHLALRRSSREKLWAEKRSAYVDAIESVEELLYWSEVTRAVHCCEPVVGVETKFDESLRKLSKLSKTGSLIYSNRFHGRLVQVYDELRSAQFEIDEESKGDWDSEAKMSEWSFILANNVRAILEEQLPHLIEVARRERLKT